MKKVRPYVLSIAGFDPSAGAGILADIKTFEQTKVYGLGITTCITFQNEDVFSGLKWLDLQDIKSQMNLLFDKYPIRYCKIGLVKDFEMLKFVILQLKNHNKDIRIIWDPVFKASAGYEFHRLFSESEIQFLLENIYLLTPNWKEAEWLFGKDFMNKLKETSKQCVIYLKGGHRPEKTAYDYLFSKGKSYPLKPKLMSKTEKHGSGCILSSALTAYLAQDYKLIKSALKSKDYVSRALESNATKLAWHKT